MKIASQINPLTNPVAPGEQIKAGDRYYWADTGMDGKWKIYEIKFHDDIPSFRQRVAEGIESQVELCAWFHYQERANNAL